MAANDIPCGVVPLAQSRTKAYDAVDETVTVDTWRQRLGETPGTGGEICGNLPEIILVMLRSARIVRMSKKR